MPQEFEQARASVEADVEQESTTVAANETSEQVDVLDAVLDDIESTLATNAEEYVSSFVQKGGE